MIPGKLNVGVACTPGLEFVTSNELDQFGVKIDRRKGRTHAAPGIIECKIGYEMLCRLNLQSRTASRVMVHIGSFFAAAFSEFCDRAEKLPWDTYLKKGQPVSVRVATIKSKLYHKKGIAERVARVISEALGEETPLANMDADRDDDRFVQQIIVRIFKDQCTISVDSSGEQLHRRGYRLRTAKAPIRENIAAAMIHASGWKGTRPLVDPFCGAGTIPIEAAMSAAGIPPGSNRPFAFQEWPGYVDKIWNRIVKETEEARVKKTPVILGYDRDEGAIEASRANAERAGVADMIEWKCQSISDFSAPEKAGWIVTNPPYGERIQAGPDLRNLYARMGSVWRDLLPMWHIYMVSSAPQLTGQLDLRVDDCASFENGGIPVKLMSVGAPE